MTIEVLKPRSEKRIVTATIVVDDSIRDITAQRYHLFNQAWVREANIGGDFYGADSHMARIGLFIGARNLEGIAGEYNNTVLLLKNLSATSSINLKAAVLAPLVVSINGAAPPAPTQQGLEDIAAAILATGITHAQLTEAVEESKKNFRPT